MIKLLETAIKNKVEELVETKKFPNQKICENFIAYVISKLDLDADVSISAWLDDEEYWSNLEVNND